MKFLIINDGIEENQDASYKVAQIYESILLELEVEAKVLHLAKKMPTMQAFNMLLENVEGVIIVNTVRWVGIGATMQTFLDLCHDFNKDLFLDRYGLIVTLAKESGEQLAENCLVRSWLHLGGKSPETLKGVVQDQNIIQQKPDILKSIEKKLEDFYRYVASKRPCLPSSIHKTVQTVTPIEQVEPMIKEDIKEQYTPDYQAATPMVSQERTEVAPENNEVSKEVNNEVNDIFEITKLFQNKLKKVEQGLSIEGIEERLKKRYKPSQMVVNHLIYSFKITGIKELYFILILEKNGIRILEGLGMESHIEISMDDRSFNQIIDGSLSLQNAFVLGKAIVKGQMALLGIFDDSM
ncbi:SCP2 sterol-binding domain-containing protein [Vallitalea okinawensis]|uniref:SCP2 sterol-binding domain-containing protein n=1 Tax=Vallitalea okinawensis TaxID=2078660 RepID=UPI000CFB9575|nr:SCP2 sterol-binding domain-containing protein [Vallitalea okinawensis]